ncbi:MAG: dihydrolipoyllysine-residue acetyltransferase [Alphaproteobacteria bacterium]|nr:dihydrolipoyllysine-residue acetyltransferase [Alphaproteobacteria bacterium]
MADLVELKVPDIGDFSDVEVIEVHVGAGDSVNEEDPLITLESDKASMEIPSSHAGKIKEIKVGLGDRVSEGTVVALIEPGEASIPVAPPSPEGVQEPDSEPPAPVVESTEDTPAPPPPPPSGAAAGGPLAPVDEAGFGKAHAGPSVRAFARELGADLSRVQGTGAKGRIVREDVIAYVKGELIRPRAETAAAVPAGAAGVGIPPVPEVDFSKFGDIETVELSRIKRLSGPALHRSWLNVPHVTHNDEADITDLDAYRKEMDTAAKEQGYRITLLAFLMKACIPALKQFPEVNSSLSPDGQSLILKKYFHIGIAVDTPGGLVVPVFRDVDRKGVVELAREMGETSARVRDGKLGPNDLQGACFTISSLGGIGGTSFTPIVNAPEVAILGVTRSQVKPVWNGADFKPRLMLPLSLSYDHRVIDGALAARFAAHLCHLLGDVRRLLH